MHAIHFAPRHSIERFLACAHSRKWPASKLPGSPSPHSGTWIAIVRGRRPSLRYDIECAAPLVRHPHGLQFCMASVPPVRHEIDHLFRRVHRPHGRKLKLRHGRHATCSTSPRGIVKPEKFCKKATFEQKHGKRQAALEGITDATAPAHLYKAFYTFQVYQASN